MTSDVRTIHQPTGQDQGGRRLSAAVLAILALAALLRLYRLGDHSLDLDEVWSLWMAQQSPSQIIGSIFLQGGDATPPTYYVLLHTVMALGQQPEVLRGLSAVAGVLVVWLTYRLAADLFDRRVAAVGAFLVAIAPLQVQYSQEARAYMLSVLWALLSLYFFARLLWRPVVGSTRWNWIGFLAASAAALYTFYLTALLLIAEGAVVAYLRLARRLDRAALRRWMGGGVLLAVAALPLALTIPLQTAHNDHSWLQRPGPAAMVKSAILFATGDPSYGSISFTPARLLSVLAIAGLGGAGAWLYIGWRNGRRDGRQEWPPEAGRALWLAAAGTMPWGLAMAVSQVRPIYHERYLLFIMPPLLILVAWGLTRSLPALPALLPAVLLVGLMGRSLFVYYTGPAPEEWQEAIAYLRAAHQTEDLVVTSPGFYFRPLTYYWQGNFPTGAQDAGAAQVLSAARAVVWQAGELRPVDPGLAQAGTAALSANTRAAKRVWLVSGYAPADPAVEAWASGGMAPTVEAAFQGARVRLWERP